MAALRSTHDYLFAKWAEEDDDGWNLIIIDDRRKRIEADFAEYFSNVPPTLVDEQGTKMYPAKVLDEAWVAISPKHAKA